MSPFSNLDLGSSAEFSQLARALRQVQRLQLTIQTASIRTEQRFTVVEVHKSVSKRTDGVSECILICRPLFIRPVLLKHFLATEN
jgi:hypothetical protein